MVVVNKWDVIKKDNSTIGSYVEKIKDKMKFLDFAPLIFVSALFGQRVLKILDKVYDCFTQCQKRIETAELNRFLAQVTHDNPPSHHLGKQIKFYYLTQGGIKPPTFIFFTNFPKAVHLTNGILPISCERPTVLKALRFGSFSGEGKENHPMIFA